MNDKFKAVGHLALSIFLALLLFSMQQPPTIKIQNQCTEHGVRNLCSHTEQCTD